MGRPRWTTTPNRTPWHYGTRCPCLRVALMLWEAFFMSRKLFKIGSKYHIFSTVLMLRDLKTMYWCVCNYSNTLSLLSFRPNSTEAYDLTGIVNSWYSRVTFSNGRKAPTRDPISPWYSMKTPHLGTADFPALRYVWLPEVLRWYHLISG